MAWHVHGRTAAGTKVASPVAGTRAAPRHTCHQTTQLTTNRTITISRTLQLFIPAPEPSKDNNPSRNTVFLRADKLANFNGSMSGRGMIKIKYVVGMGAQPWLARTFP